MCDENKTGIPRIRKQNNQLTLKAVKVKWSLAYDDTSYSGNKKGLVDQVDLRLHFITVLVVYELKNEEARSRLKLDLLDILDIPIMPRGASQDQRGNISTGL